MPSQERPLHEKLLELPKAVTLQARRTRRELRLADVERERLLASWEGGQSKRFHCEYHRWLQSGTMNDVYFEVIGVAKKKA